MDGWGSTKGGFIMRLESDLSLTYFKLHINNNIVIPVVSIIVPGSTGYATQACILSGKPLGTRLIEFDLLTGAPSRRLYYYQ